MTPADRAVRVRRGAVRCGALLALAALACSSGSNGVGVRFAAPADMAVFAGITRKNAGLHDYLAVASSRGDEIVLVDPFDDQPVLGPGVVYALSIPTEPRPLRVAAASLGDRDTGAADLLVAVSAGSLDLQVIETWTASNRVAARVSLAPLVGEGEVLSVAGLTPAGAAPGSARARILVGVTGGRLAVVDFTRDSQTGGVIPQQPVLQAIGIDAVAMAVEPGGTRLFMATPDPMTAAGGATVSGVAFLDAGGDAALPWPLTAIDARGPTSTLSVARVNERLVSPTNPAAPDTFQGTAELRIYAALDQAGCGSDRAIPCGIAMLDEHGLLPDPTGELPFRAPLVVPGIPSGIAIAGPPSSGPARIAGDAKNPGLVLMVAQPGARDTTAIAAVSSSDGRVYLYDLGRYSPVTATTALAGGIGVASALSQVPVDVATEGSSNFGKDLQLGLWTDFPVAVASPRVATAATSLPALVQVTPGYTATDVWAVTWQGALPGLDGRRAVVGRSVTGEIYVAFQANAGTVAQPVWVVGADLNAVSSGVRAADAFGIHAGDAVIITLDDPAMCPASADPAHPYPEPTVATDVQVLPSDPARFPGGALKLAAGSCFEASLAPGQVTTAAATVRASGLVLTSDSRGYLGRPVLDQIFVLQHGDEATLSGEALAVARKLRRQFYPIDAPCPTTSGAQAPTPGCYPGFPLIADPLAPGPVLAFRPGVTHGEAPAGSVGLNPADPAVLGSIARGTRIQISTAIGNAPAFMRPTTGGVIPSRVVAYDRTKLAGHENDLPRFFALYRDDQVLDFSPSYPAGDPRYIR